MPINEIFPNPTVKQVIFQIRFPNLFFIENKIGDIQLKIMDKFPKSALLFQRELLLVNLGPGMKLEDLPIEAEKGMKKIWQFVSENNVKLDITSDSLALNSEYHKTYNLGAGDKFRDVISFTLGHFFEATKIPLINRIGLRYIDECPIPSKDNETFKSYYNSTFPLDRYNLADADEMLFKAKVRNGDYFFRYIESLELKDNVYKLVLDFDGFAEKIKSEECLAVTDKLHDIILGEYEDKIKDPVKQYMRNPIEEKK